MVLPNLLVIGAMKAGTTSFHEMLNQHPDIFMSEVKEINYFTDEIFLEKDLEWYSSHFTEGKDKLYRGESSVSYTKQHRYPNVVQNIYNSLGRGVKFIYILRDPIDRFQSNFTDSKTYGDIPSNYDINRFVKNQPLDINPIAQTSRYFHQMKDYLETFNIKDFLFLEFESLVNNPKQILNVVFEFLGLKKFDIESVYKNISKDKTFYNERISILNHGKALKKILPSRLKTVAKNSTLFKMLFKSNVKSAVNQLDQESYNILKLYFSSDVMELRNQIYFSPKNWNSYNI